MIETTLNIPLDMQDHQWEILSDVYKELDGWSGYSEDGLPVWYSDPDCGGEGVTASAEPSGLLLISNLPSELWESWLNTFIEKASEKLQFIVKDAED